MDEIKKFRKEESVLFYPVGNTKSIKEDGQIGKILFTDKLYANRYCILGANHKVYESKIYENIPNYQINKDEIEKILEKIKEIHDYYNGIIMESYEELIRDGTEGVEGTERIEKVKRIIAQTIAERNARLDKLSDERINHLLKEVE